MMKIKATGPITALLLALCFVFYMPAASALDDDFSLTFVIDTSGSMRGERIIEVKKSITSIVNNLEIEVPISIITFNNQAETKLTNELDPKKVLDVVNNLEVVGGTALFDAVSLAVNSQSDRSIVIVFSDGEDNSSTTTLINTRRLVNRFPGYVSLVGIGNGNNLQNTLIQLAGNNAKVISVTDISTLLDELNSILQPIIKNEIDKAETALQSYQFTYNGMKIDIRILFLILFIGALSMLISFSILINSRADRIKKLELLSEYDVSQSEAEESSLFFKLMRFPILSQYVERQQKRLLAAGITIQIQNWIYLQLGTFISLALFFQFLSLSPILSFIMAGLFGFGGGTLYLNYVKGKKSKQFADELPDTLTIIAGSLRSGLSFTQAITSVARESDGEVGLQFRRVLAEVQVGRNLIDSLLDVAERMDSADFQWTISALTIQREIGGNLSEILTTTAEAIRGRAEIRNEIRALSAEGRMSAYVLIALPMLMLGYLRITNPASFTSLFVTPLGLAMMAVVVILMIVGWIWVQKVVSIKLT